MLTGRDVQQETAAPRAPLQCRGGASLQGVVKSDEGHPVRASSLPAFSTDLHKHHVTAHRETHLKPKEEERR